MQKKKTKKMQALSSYRVRITFFIFKPIILILMSALSSVLKACLNSALNLRCQSVQSDGTSILSQFHYV